MATQTIFDLIAAYNVKEFGAMGDGNGDDGARINEAITYVSQQSRANGLLFVPPGTYRIYNTPIAPVSNIMLFGMGAVTILQLGTGANVDIIRASGISKLRLKDLRIDGNRANNTDGTGNGVHMVSVTDSWLDNVEVVSCRGDGFYGNTLSRVKFTNCQSSDNGRHGFGFDFVEYCRFFGVDAFDNSRVSASGVGDGINLDIFSHDNTLIAPACYESAETGGRQGYGVREASAGGCNRNLIIGGTFRANATGDFLLGPDSLAISSLGILRETLGLGTTSPDASALLDLVSVTQGLGIPIMTTVQRNAIASPRAGLVVYDTTLAKLLVRVAAAWETVTSA